jgi:hypothetical protein
MTASPSNQQIRLLPKDALADTLRDFIIDRRARGLSARTVVWYEEKPAPLMGHLSGRGISTLAAVTPPLLREYLPYIGEQHNAGGVHGHYRAMRCLLNWYSEDSAPDGWKNPMRKVQPPRVPEEPLEPFDGSFQFSTQAREAMTDQIAQFNAFQILPDAFVGVQFRRIGWQALDPYPLRGPGGQEVLHGLAAVDWQAIPDHQQLAGYLAQQLLQKADYIGAFERSLLHLQVQLPGRRDRADGRQMIPGQPLPQHGCLSHRVINTHYCGQGTEARLVHKDHGAPFVYHFVQPPASDPLSKRGSLPHLAVSPVASASADSSRTLAATAPP